MRNEENNEIIEETEVENTEEKKRIIVIPGEVIVSGKEYLPSDGTLKQNEDIIANRYGLADISGRLVKVIPLSGVYIPRIGNTVIGKVIDVNFAGWNVDIKAPYSAFLLAPRMGRDEPRQDLTELFEIDDLVVCKILSIKRKGIDLTVRGRELGILEDGMIININSNKVPRIIGKMGSMINMIKKETNCNIVVGQNGLIWIKGDNVEEEIRAKEAIMFICERSYVGGLTDKVQEFLEKSK